MKKMLILGLCAVMTFGAFLPSAQAAAQPYVRDRAAYERDRDFRRGGPRGPDRRPPPPPRRNDYRYRDRHRHGGSGWLGFGIGAAIGTAIGAAVANSAPTPQQTMVFDPSCNCYYYR